MIRLSFRIVAIVAVLTIGASAFAELPGPFNNDPPGDPGSGNGCSYCSQTHCGCAAAPPGYRLSSWSCACGTGTCTQSCDYTPL